MQNSTDIIVEIIQAEGKVVRSNVGHLTKRKGQVIILQEDSPHGAESEMITACQK